MHGVRTQGALGPRARAGVGGATHVLRKDVEADAADQERTAAVPAGSDACQNQRESERARRILRRLGISEETCRASKGMQSGRSYEGVAGPRDMHGVRTRGALGPLSAGATHVLRERVAAVLEGWSARQRHENRKRAREADIATTGHQ